MTTVKKEVGISIVKTFFGAIPYVGTALDEVIFENRSRIKQNRINQFALLLQEYFEEHGISNEEIENIKSEDFSDVFESVLQRVAITKNQEKLERFRNILIGQMKGSERNDFIDTYLDITSRLNDRQIQILEKFAVTKRRLDSIEKVKEELKVKIHKAEVLLSELKKKAENGTIQLHESISKAHREVTMLIFDKTKIEQEQLKIEEIKTSLYYNLNEVDFQFYLQDMVSKSLLKDIPVTLKDSTSLVLKDITEFGMRYYDFLNEK
jgi:hypothetical protein